MARYREYLHGQVRELLTGYGEISYLFYDFSYPERQMPQVFNNKGARRLGLGRADGPHPGAPAGHRDQRPTRHPRRPGHPRAVPAGGAHAAGRRAGRVGGLPDDQRQLGLLPRQHAVQDPGDAGPDARRRGQQGRQPAVQHRPDRTGQLRPGVGGDPGRTGRVDRRCTAAPSTAPDPATFAPPHGLPLHPARRPALPAPVRLAVRARAPARARWQGRRTPSCSTTPPRSPSPPAIRTQRRRTPRWAASRPAPSR